MQRNKRVERVADEVSQGERQCHVDFVARPEWNSFQPLTHSSLAYHVAFACLGFLICDCGNNNSQRCSLRMLHMPD